MIARCYNSLGTNFSSSPCPMLSKEIHLKKKNELENWTFLAIFFACHRQLYYLQCIKQDLNNWKSGISLDFSYLTKIWTRRKRCRWLANFIRLNLCLLNWPYLETTWEWSQVFDFKAHQIQRKRRGVGTKGDGGTGAGGGLGVLGPHYFLTDQPSQPGGVGADLISTLLLDPPPPDFQIFLRS